MTRSADILGKPLTLPCGLVLPNRLAKAAMTEQLADSKRGDPNERHRKLYERFAQGGLGLVISGNVMIHRDHREHPRNVVIDADTSKSALTSWQQAAAAAPLVLQLSHPGRQALYAKDQPVAPSAIGLQGLGPLFKTPRALDEAGIEDVIVRFVNAARVVDECGFAGVQIHGAHGYLINQFLSPRANVRTDKWGGSLENRARLLLEIVTRTRAVVKPSFAVMVKLNSADFQKGGFDDNDAIDVMKMLEGKIDLLEISGGSYEAPAMVGAGPGSSRRSSPSVRESTRKREAYFLEFAARARSSVPKLPLMVTGGFRTPAAMAEAIVEGACDVVGLARPVAVDPDLPKRILAGDEAKPVMPKDTIGVRALDAILSTQTYVESMHRIADGRAGIPSRLYTLAHTIWMSRG